MSEHCGEGSRRHSVPRRELKGVVGAYVESYLRKPDSPFSVVRGELVIPNKRLDEEKPKKIDPKDLLSDGNWMD